MSITDDARPQARPGQPAQSADTRSEATFERTPPQDVAAEQCVLGGMLLSKDAIADVIEIIKAADFYKPANATIYDAILDLYGRGEPADPITVAAALADAGELGRVGGGPYLHTLIASVPTAANAGYYARIVSERAVLRRLVEAGTRIVQLGYRAAAGAGRDVDDVVDLAQQTVYDVTERRVSEDFAVLADMLQPTLDEIEAVGAQGGLMTGVPTGFTDLDRLLNGLHPGQLIVVAGRPGLGKALALDTPLPTPDGWTTMCDVKPGDVLMGANGRPTTVVHAFDVMHNRPCYEVEFSDGSVIVADADHLWKTTTRASRRQPAELFAALDQRANRLMNVAATTVQPEVVTTVDIANSFRHPIDRRLSHAVENARPLSLPDRDDFPIPPYTLGVWLGDGHSSATQFTTADPEIVTYIEADGFVARPLPLHYAITVPPLGPLDGCASCGRPGGGTGSSSRRCASCRSRYGSFIGHLRAAGVFGDKHIPVNYLRASESQRRDLLAGLLDTAGAVMSSGSVQFSVASRWLAEDARELIASLGYRCSLAAKPVKGRKPEISVAHTLNFATDDDVFRLERKRMAHKERRQAAPDIRTGSRFIVAVRPIQSVPVRCITVASSDHMYLAGRSMIPTHNSTLATDVVRHAAIRVGHTSAIFSLEMSKIEIVMRLLAAEARVPLHVLRSGQLSDDDWTKLARCMGEISEAPLFVDDTPNMNLMEIRAKARRLKQRHDLKVIVVDYLQLMTSPKRVESRQQEVAELSRGLKLLAKEVECPVIAVSQLNRGPEQRTDKRPQLSDLRESGSIEQDADVVILLHRDDYYDKESPRAGEADFIVAKHRNGPTDTVTVAAQLHLSRFVDMAIV